VSLVVVCLPVALSGEEGSGAVWARDYAADLAGHLAVGVTLWDESFSSQDASASLRARGKRAHWQRARLDAVAAAFILQSYLDAHQVVDPSEGSVSGS
jgi:putative holliday junction resolvase